MFSRKLLDSDLGNNLKNTKYNYLDVVSYDFTKITIIKLGGKINKNVIKHYTSYNCFTTVCVNSGL